MNLYVFDMGNVVIRHIHFLKEIASRLGMDESLFIADYRHYEFPLMEGVVSEGDYWKHLERVHNVVVKGNPFADCFHPQRNEPAIALIAALRERGERVVCGSNTIRSHWEMLRSMGLVDGLFDHAYASHEIMLAKPDASFYRYIMEKEGFPAHESWFVDDSKVNVKGATDLGMHGLVYDLEDASSQRELASL